MNRRMIAGIAVIAVLAVTGVAAFTYIALAPQTAGIDGFQTLPTNPGLAANASSWDRSAPIGQNLTAIVNLSPQWAVIVKNLSIATPGFSILSLNASLPLLVDQNVTISLVFRSNQSYSGSVLLILGCINASGLPEKILVPDVVVDGQAKAVTQLSIFNAGDVLLTNSTAYLVRSDGFVANSTPLDTEGQLPGKTAYFTIEMTYADATTVEIYYAKVVTAGGATATSRAIWFCNC